jgi:hypothetical protein
MSPQVVDRARVASARVHRGPNSGRRPKLTGARPSGHSGAWRLAAEAREANGWCGDPSGRLILCEGAARPASGGRERSSVSALSVRGARGEEMKRGEPG